MTKRYEGMRQAKCGNCGCLTATVAFDQSDGEAPFIRALQLTCSHCGSRTDIVIATNPKIGAFFPRDEGEKDKGIFFV